MFLVAVALVGILAAGIASIAGFAIGSLLTPLVAAQYGMKTAVAGIAVPHATKEEPQYFIKSDKTDHVALHKGSALRLLKSSAITKRTTTSRKRRTKTYAP